MLGPFDLDPCAADPRPWDCARPTSQSSMTAWRLWLGRVYLNPPFNRYEVGDWIRKLADHGCGTALLHARTEAGWFEPSGRAHQHSCSWPTDQILSPDGSDQPANSGAPPVLVAFGDDDARRLRNSGIAGSFVTGWTWLPGRPSPQASFVSLNGADRDGTPSAPQR